MTPLSGSGSSIEHPIVETGVGGRAVVDNLIVVVDNLLVVVDVLLLAVVDALPVSKVDGLVTMSAVTSCAT